MATELHDTSPAPVPQAAAAAKRHRWRYLLGILGPGLITGAADDDPSGIATYSQTGAQFGYGQLWTALWMLPLVTGVQEACGRIGNITGQGLSRNIKEKYSLRTLRLLVILLGRYFYGVIAASMLIGLCLNFIGVNPIQALVFAAVFNGVIAVPLIWFVSRIASDRRVMGNARSGWLSRITLAITFIGMAGSVVAMAVSYLKG